MTTHLEELIAATTELRSLPSTTMQLMALLDDDTVEAPRVLEVIEKDPSLTSNLLKLANSAYYGVRRQVGSAREALVMLGNQTVVNLAFAASMGDVLRGPLASYRMERGEMWRHALGTALGASQLAASTGYAVTRERAFTAGLVHDIGKLLLNRPLKDHLEQLPPDGSMADLLAAETDILGFHHAEAGARLGEEWNFPPYLVDTIARHHNPGEGEEDALVRAVAAANLVTCHLGQGGGCGPLDLEVLTAESAALGYPPEAVEPLVRSLPGDLESLLGKMGGPS